MENQVLQSQYEKINSYFKTTTEPFDFLEWNEKNLNPIVCTQEAKQCPGGSYVGRTGPNCEFGICPGAPSTSEQPLKYPTFTELGVTITPLEVIRDSRCPRGAECVWAGIVDLKARLEYAGYSQEELLELGGSSTYFNGKNIELISVTPAKVMNKTILPEEYKFTFRVNQPVVDATGQHCGGFIKNAPTCPSGYHCKLRLIADTGGECVKDSEIR